MNTRAGLRAPAHSHTSGKSRIACPTSPCKTTNNCGMSKSCHHEATCHFALFHSFKKLEELLTPLTTPLGGKAVAEALSLTLLPPQDRRGWARREARKEERRRPWEASLW